MPDGKELIIDSKDPRVSDPRVFPEIQAADPDLFRRSLAASLDRECLWYLPDGRAVKMPPNVVRAARMTAAKQLATIPVMQKNAMKLVQVVQDQSKKIKTLEGDAAAMRQKIDDLEGLLADEIVWDDIEDVKRIADGVRRVLLPKGVE